MRLCSQSLIPAIEPAPDKARNNPSKKEWKVTLSSPLDAQSERAATAMGTASGVRTKSSWAFSREGSQIFSRGFLAPYLDLKGVNSPQKTSEQPEEWSWRPLKALQALLCSHTSKQGP